MNTLLEDIIDSLELTPSAITGKDPLTWATSHLFYNESLGILGVGGQNRGRTPFCRIYRGEKNYEIGSINQVGGSVDSQFFIEIVVNPQSIKSQEKAWDQAFAIWESFLVNLKDKNNYFDTSYNTEKLQVSNVMFILRCTLTVRNTWGN